MKYVFPEISRVFDTEGEYISTLIIENQELFINIVSDIYNQLQGLDGRSVVSVNDKVLDFAKNVELINQFIPFDINKKTILTKLAGAINKLAISSDFYEDTMNEISTLEKYLWSITESLEGNIRFSKLSIENIIKSVAPEFEDDYDSLGEKIIDYMELVREYDKDKLFVFVNLRSYIKDTEVLCFFDTIKRKNYHVLLIDSSEHKLLDNEKRYLIDSDLCEIECKMNLDN